MSSLYNLEPQPTAKVLLETTSGDLELELFAKQTPLTSRNFLQLCLDGYYTNTIFHRLVPGFVLQGGDPTGTSDGGEAIYEGGVCEDEFHSRLKFNRRGLLGMANGGGKNENGSQFFLTLGKTEELQGRNTMFGRVVGDTVYNLVKMGEEEVGIGERPMYPTRITAVVVLVNPFDEMVGKAGENRVRSIVEEKKEEKKEGKRKGMKKAGKTLLSFGGEGGEDDEIPPVVKRAKYNNKLVSIEDGTYDVTGDNWKPKKVTKSTEKALRRKASKSPSPPRRTTPSRELQPPLPNDEKPSTSPSTSPEPAAIGQMSSLLVETNAQIAKLKESMKRNISYAPAEPVYKKSALEKMIPENSMRGRKRKHGVNGNADAQALSIMRAFQAKLKQAPPKLESLETPTRELGSGDTNQNDDVKSVDDEEEARLCDLHFIVNCQSCGSWDKHISESAEMVDEDDKGWMSHALSFEKDRLGKDLNWKKKNEEELVVIDPREKAKEILEGQLAKRPAKNGSGKAWDRDRDRGRVPEKRAGERG
ncbi:Peptidyl-prolyl isomerase cwc27 [Toensbergia leucococca]|nr:Peptidyl-prolyl isomerase cwc27 [Toensbergia leucococca]